VRWSVGALALGAACAVGRTAVAGGGAATDAYQDVRPRAPLDVRGLIDLYAQHALGRPRFLPVQLRAFDVHSDVLSLSFARLTVARRPREGADGLGFRLDAGVGDTPDGYLRSDPAASAHPGLSRALSYVEQAFVTARLPLGRGIDVDAGKFGTPVGLEDNETQQNRNTSRSLLYSWAEPTVHTGLRVTVPLSDTLAISAFWVNGWNANVLDGNGMRTFAGAASWRPAPEWDVGAVTMAGPERAPQRLADPALSFRHVVDAFATYSPVRAVTLAATADYGHAAAGGGAAWWGAGGYVTVRPTRWLAGTLRGERYDDPGGFTTGTAQRLAELTVTVELRTRVAGVTLIGRLEARRDRSDARFFDARTPASSTHQDTVGLGMTVVF
jgi:hypothetical protein